MDCTIDDLLKRVNRDILYGWATDDTNPEMTPEHVIEAACEAATNEINGWLGNKTISSGMRKKLAVDITIYTLKCNKGMILEKESPDYVIYENYNRAVKYLEKISDSDGINENLASPGIDVSTAGKVFDDALWAKF